MTDAPVMNICMHGIGQSDETFYKEWMLPQLLGVPDGQVTGFYYDDLLDKSRMGLWESGAHLLLSAWGAKRLNALVSVPKDYLDDVLTFFLCEDVRDMIEYRLYAAIKKHSRVRLFAYSLGSIVAYWFLLRYPELAEKVELVTLGCPMGSPVLRGMVRYWLKRITEKPLLRPEVLSWCNVYSVLDPLSGNIWTYGCHASEQVEIPFFGQVAHTNTYGYIDFYGRWLRESSEGPAA